MLDQQTTRWLQTFLVLNKKASFIFSKKLDQKKPKMTNISTRANKCKLKFVQDWMHFDWLQIHTLQYVHTFTHTLTFRMCSLSKKVRGSVDWSSVRKEKAFPAQLSKQVTMKITLREHITLLQHKRYSAKQTYYVPPFPFTSRTLSSSLSSTIKGRRSWTSSPDPDLHCGNDGGKSRRRK